jgi:selenocysteine-specific elongation factor
VINPFPGRRHHRFRVEVVEQLETLAHGSPDEILLQDLERQQPCEVRDLLGRTSLAREQARTSLQSVVAEGQILVLAGGSSASQAKAFSDSSYVVSRSGWGAVREQLEGLLGDYHHQFPLRAGMPREEVKSRLTRYVATMTPRLFNEIITQAMAEGWLAEGAGGADRIRLASHQASFAAKQQQSVDYLFHLFHESPYATPSVAQCEEQVGSEVLNALIEQGQLIRVSDEVIFLTETYDEMRDDVITYIRDHGSITVAQFRDLFGTSRKYALALLGYLDEKRITRRVGDERVLR